MREVVVHDVGLRDGLQAEKTVVPTEQKFAWLLALARSGVDLIQVGSFVHPQKVPQMADTDRLFERLRDPETRPPGVVFTALVLNEKGLDRGLACGVAYFCMGVSASDTHSRRNTGMDTDEAVRHIAGVARRAMAAGTAVQLSVQSAFGCGYEGPVPEGRVVDLVKRLLDTGARTISLADTAGHAHPEQIKRLFSAVRELDPSVELVCHLHDTYGLGLANCYAALEVGVKGFEAAFGGLGGCPFTAVPAGNVATEDLVHLLHRMDLRRDIALDPLIALARDAERFFGRPLPGTIHRMGPVPQGPRADTLAAGPAPDRRDS
jgi:hydroxymethylglutaryl-CoA lyase